MDVPLSCWFFKIFQLDLRMCTSVHYSYQGPVTCVSSGYIPVNHLASHPLALIWAFSGLSPVKVLHTFVSCHN